jgi:hypothetical protein
MTTKQMNRLTDIFTKWISLSYEKMSLPAINSEKEKIEWKINANM